MNKQKILIADDEIDNVVLLQKRLKASGFDTIAAHDGDEAVRQALTYIPDLVLLDIMMPLKDGYEVLRYLRANEETKNVPVIMLTAKAETPDKVRGLELGAVDYVTKPFDYNELLARINASLDLKKEVTEKIKTEKLEALSVMMEGVAHEVRNPLVVIGGFSKKLLTMTGRDDPRYQYIAAIEKQVGRLERMIKDMYEFKTISIDRAEEAGINGCVSDALSALDKTLASKNIRLTTAFYEKDSMIMMDRKQFVKALTNIIDNAIDAMPEGGELGIRTAADDKSFFIHVVDSGIGIKEDDLAFIYDPFFTSKMEGTGLGLTLALKIMEAHGGAITIKSTHGIGTTVTIEVRTSDIVSL